MNTVGMFSNNVGDGRGWDWRHGPYHRNWSTEAPDCALISSHKAQKACKKKIGKSLICVSYHNTLSYLSYNLYGWTRYSNQCIRFCQFMSPCWVKALMLYCLCRAFMRENNREKTSEVVADPSIIILSHSLIIIPVWRLIINSQAPLWLLDCYVLSLPMWAIG